jgi:hypothetical protein
MTSCQHARRVINSTKRLFLELFLNIRKPNNLNGYDQDSVIKTCMVVFMVTITIISRVFRAQRSNCMKKQTNAEIAVGPSLSMPKNFP